VTHTLIVYAHPWTGSLNHAILEAVTSALEAAGRPYDVIDLLADGFDPRYDAAELALFRSGGTNDPLVTRYQGLVERATRLVVIAPVWWNDVPAVLKGFIDKVMKQQWAYVPTGRGIRGRLGHVEEALVLTTSTSPTWYLRLARGNAVRRTFVGATLRQLGIRRRRWVNYGRVGSGGPERVRRHLERVARLAVG